MSIPEFKFTPVQLNTPLDNLTAAISIIQTQILAVDPELKPEILFGSYNFPTAQMELAVALLVGMLGELEAMQWHDEKP
ncbi:MAG TPA: hypothetical protein VIQ22_00800 [Gammaproteobacteria bacterium]